MIAWKLLANTSFTQGHLQDKPGVYERFLEVLQVYQREKIPVQDLISQVTTIFNSAPELLEDFKIILPKLKSSVSNPEDVDHHDPAAFSRAIAFLNKVKVRDHR